MTDDEDRGKTGSSEPASDEDLTAADIELIHTVVDDQSEEEREQLGREAEAGGGPLTERVKATVMLASRSKTGDRSSDPRENGSARSARCSGETRAAQYARVAG